MRLLTRYLFKEILHYFLIFLGIAIIIMLVNEVYDERSGFVERSPEIADFLKYLVLSIPAQLLQVLPLIGLVSTMFSFGMLAKNREVLAMVAAGVSFRRLAIPAAIFGLGLVAFNLLLAEWLVPVIQPHAKRLEQVELRGRQETVFTKRNDLFVKGEGNRFYYMERYLPETREMQYPTIIEGRPDGAGMTERIEAERAVLVADATGGGRFWEFTGAERWVFDDKGLVRSYEQYGGAFQIKMEEDLEKFLSRTKKPEEMNYLELREYRDLQERIGADKLAAFSISLQHKLSFPVACALMAFLGFCVVVDVHARHFARGVFVGLLVAVGFYVLDALLSNLGQQGVVGPVVAAWLPIACFVAINFFLLTQLERVRR